MRFLARLIEGMRMNGRVDVEGGRINLFIGPLPFMLAYTIALITRSRKVGYLVVLWHCLEADEGFWT